MTVLGVTFTSIAGNCNREIEREGSITVNSIPTIKNVEKKDLKIQGMQDILKIDFDFKTSYEPKIGEIIVSGELLYQVNDSKKAIELWKKEKRLEEAVGIEVINTVIRCCLPKTIVISSDLRLPPPVQFPIARVKKQDNEK